MKRDEHNWSPSHWISSRRQGETLADDLELLLADFCKEWGICSVLADDILGGRDTITSDDFACRVLIAEGFPSDELPINRQQELRKIFEARYGKSTSQMQFNADGAE